MLNIVFRKMINNKWMFACLLIGCLFVVALVSSIPIYTHGILQRMLIKDLENFQKDKEIFPGSYEIEMNLYQYLHDGTRNVFQEYDKIFNNMADEINLPVKESAVRIGMDYLMLNKGPETLGGKDVKKPIMLDSLKNMEDHVEIIAGRMYDENPVDGVYEVIISQAAMKNLQLVLDREYIIYDIMNKMQTPLRVKVVGVFTRSDTQDIFWFNRMSEYNESLFLSQNALMNFIADQPSPLTKAEWYFGFDYYSISVEEAGDIVSTMDKHFREYVQRRDVRIQIPCYNILKEYFERETHLKTTLWILMVPVLIMLSFYTFMISRLIIGSEENEISLLKSRGASSMQIFRIYLIESLLISAVSIPCGLVIGIFLCKIIGACNGFLEFVQRTALPVKINATAVLYAAISILIFMISMLVPAFKASRVSIVIYKQTRARSEKKPLWQVLYLDVVVLAISIYGLYRYKTHQDFLQISGVKGTELEIDPLLFLISTLFMLGAGMLFLRIYPFIVRIIFLIGRDIWSPSLYASFIKVSRSQGSEKFIMLFIILSISIGIFNANEARTINQNIEDKVSYKIGADVRLMAVWHSNAPSGNESMYMGGMEEETYNPEFIRYQEPPFHVYTQLEGVENAARVYINEEVSVRALDQTVKNTKLMAIKPDEFGKTAWFRADLLPYHWYNYLNLMSLSPRAALVSRDFQEKYGVQKGDVINVSWGKSNYIDCMVYEFIDYWPGFNPVEESLVVANLPYIQTLYPIEPYEVWIKKKDGELDRTINNAIIDNELELEEISYIGQEIIKQKNDPLLQGTNGALTLGFLVTMIITTIGFLIYWILSIKSRVLHFGIFRAMGMKLRSVIGMLVFEQVLISCAAIVVGIIVGGISSQIFVPLLQMVYSSAEQVPPFRVIASGEDYIKIYAIVGFMLLVGFAVLSRIISKIKIDQALKLGED